MTTNMNTKTPRELLAECGKQLSADVRYELSLEIAALKAAQPEPAANADFDTWAKNPYTLVLQKSIAEDYIPRCCDQCTDGTAPAAPYQVTPEDAKQVRIDWVMGNGPTSNEDMRIALQSYEARKAAA